MGAPWQPVSYGPALSLYALRTLARHERQAAYYEDMARSHYERFLRTGDTIDRSWGVSFTQSAIHHRSAAHRIRTTGRTLGGH